MLGSMTESKKRVTVFPNGKRIGGKAVLIPKKWTEFLKLVSKKLVIPVIKIYNEDGGEIDDVDALIPKEILYASCGEPFIYTDLIPPPPTQLVTQTITTMSPPPPTPMGIPTTPTPQGTSVVNYRHSTQMYYKPVMDKVVGCYSVDSGFSGNEWVTINVGGRLFTTTRSTILSRDKDSMLAKMFSESWDSSRDVNGAYLIDRSPEYFAPILNYLRCGTVVVDDGLNVEGVYQEARFFNITGMIEKLSQMVERRNSYDQFTRKDVISILLTSSTNSSLRCQGLNLSGVDLSKLDLRNINFKMTNFKDTNLSKCNLDNALLQEADFSGADLSGASLKGTNLTGANLEECNLKGANFEDRGGQRAILENCNFKNAILEEVNFSGACLRVSNFKGANLENCNFRGADLAGANLEDTNLRGANLHKANLIGVNLRGANFDIRTVSSR